MGMNQVQEVKAATDIVQLIGERISLVRAGTNWRALCPFHSEKSPSFYVNESLQRYRCFGCSESGDVFTFLEKIEGLTFYESLKTLAQKSGIQLQDHHANSDDKQREVVLEILHLSAEYYHHLLVKHPVGQVAREYLENRRVSHESIKVFQLGYSLPSWDGLITYLCDKKKYLISDLLAAGLVVQSSGGRYYDRFRGRVMFPLTDSRGRIVGFSGRTLDEAEKTAKYINSPETTVYHKSQLLYGYSQLFHNIRNSKEAVVVEGEFDVIASSQAHVNNVVGVKGSALTLDHIKLLRRTVATVLLSFDSDSAGVAACRRAIGLARGEGVEIRVIVLPTVLKAKDPGELAISNPSEWRKAVQSAVSAFEFLIDVAVKSWDTQTAEGKKKIVNEVAPLFGLMTHEIERSHYLGYISKKLEVKEKIILADINNLLAAGKLLKSPTLKNVPPTPEVEVAQSSSRLERLEKFALFLILHSESNLILEKAAQVAKLGSVNLSVKYILESLLKTSGGFELKAWSQRLPDDMQKFVTEIFLQPEAMRLAVKMDHSKEWSKMIESYSDLIKLRQVASLSLELERLEKIQDDQKSEKDKFRQEELLELIVKLR